MLWNQFKKENELWYCGWDKARRYCDYEESSVTEHTIEDLMMMTFLIDTKDYFNRDEQDAFYDKYNQVREIMDNYYESIYDWYVFEIITISIIVMGKMSVMVEEAKRNNRMEISKLKEQAEDIQPIENEEVSTTEELTPEQKEQQEQFLLAMCRKQFKSILRALKDRMNKGLLCKRNLAGNRRKTVSFKCKSTTICSRV